MKVVYSVRASEDLRHAAAYYRDQAGPAVAADIENRIRGLVERLSMFPLSAPVVSGRPSLRMAFLLAPPFHVFYRVRRERLEIVHIRHATRRPWRGQGG